MTLYRTILLSALAAGLFIASLRSRSQAQDVDSTKKHPQMVDRAIASLATKGQYDALLKKADAYVKATQWGPTHVKERVADVSDVKFGGAGYGRTNDRPDLSNASFFLDALKATGNEANSDAIQRALVFVSRCQNL